MKVINNIEKVLNEYGAYIGIIQGDSMMPMHMQGRDRVVIEKPDFPLKKYDVPLYVRADGTIVLHRIVKVLETQNGRQYFMRGDNTWPLEKDIDEKNMVAVLSRFCRKGKWYDADDKRHIAYAKMWCFLFPLRLFVFKCFNFLARVIKKFCRIIKGK